MRIGIVSPIFRDPEKHGGITPVVLNLATGLAERGIDVDLLSRRTDPNTPLPLTLPGNVQVLDIPSRHRHATALALSRHMKSNGLTALLAAGHQFNVAAAWASKLVPETRVVLSVHNTMSREALQRGRLHRIKRMGSISAFYGWADGIVAVSMGVADDLIANSRLSSSDIRVIYNPIVDQRMLARSMEPVKHPWFEPGGLPVILGVGRLSKQKAFHFLLEAFARIRLEVPCRLVLLGEGPERAHLENLARQLRIAQHVYMPGFVRNPFSFMSRASVFALSSIYEGFGNVLVESLGVGTPVVSTDCPSGPSEILKQGRYGHLVPPGNPAALSEAILHTLRNPPPASQHINAIKPYEIDTVVEQYLDFLI